MADGASLVAQRVKRLPAMQETQVWSLRQEDPLEKEMATHSSTLAWKIPWMEKPDRLQSMVPQRVGHNWATWLSLSAWQSGLRHWIKTPVSSGRRGTGSTPTAAKKQFWACHLVLVVKNLTANAGDIRDLGLIPGLGRSPAGGHGNPLQYSCLENPHGQRSQVGCSPWGHKKSDLAYP